MHIQLIANEPKAFSSLIAKYGRFRNVNNYIAVVAPKGRQGSVSAGYWGERLVLALQMPDLRTCRVGASYKKDMSLFQMGTNEDLKCVISFAYGANDGTQHPQKKTIADVAENRSAAADFPDWFVRGMEAVAEFSLIDYPHLDLGIAKYHFEVGS